MSVKYSLMRGTCAPSVVNRSAIIAGYVKYDHNERSKEEGGGVIIGAEREGAGDDDDARGATDAEDDADADNDDGIDPLLLTFDVVDSDSLMLLFTVAALIRCKLTRRSLKSSFSSSSFMMNPLSALFLLACTFIAIVIDGVTRIGPTMLTLSGKRNITAGFFVPR